MLDGLPRRLRGAVGTGIVWGAVWAAANLVYLAVLAIVTGFGFPPWRAIYGFLAGGAMGGFLAGTIFSVGLSIAFRRRSLEQIRPLWFGLLGAGAGVLLPLIGIISGASPFSAPILAVNLLLGTGLGAATSLTSLRLAKSASDSIESTSPLTEIGEVRPTG